MILVLEPPRNSHSGSATKCASVPLGKISMQMLSQPPHTRRRVAYTILDLDPPIWYESSRKCLTRPVGVGRFSLPITECSRQLDQYRSPKSQEMLGSCSFSIHFILQQPANMTWFRDSCCFWQNNVPSTTKIIPVLRSIWSSRQSPVPLLLRCGWVTEAPAESGNLRGCLQQLWLIIYHHQPGYQLVIPDVWLEYHIFSWIRPFYLFTDAQL